MILFGRDKSKFVLTKFKFMKKIFLTSITLLSIGILFSCGDNKNDKESSEKVENTTNDSESGKETETTETTDAGAELTTNAAALAKAETALKDLPKFKGKEINVFQKIYFYEDGRIIVSLQDPEKPQNIDEYTYKDGKWSEPVAMQISGGGDMKDNVFPLNTIKFETVAKIIEQLEQKAKEVEGAKVSKTVYYNYNVMNQTGQWFTNIDRTRESFSGYFNADGSLKSFNKN